MAGERSAELSLGHERSVKDLTQEGKLCKVFYMNQNSGPYLVTTTPTEQVFGNEVRYDERATRRAAVTLEDAKREHVAPLVTGLPNLHPAVVQYDALPEQGGTVGPLPDGTTIEVKPVEWDVLREVLTSEQRDRGVTGAETIAAANAHFEAHGPSSDAEEGNG